MIETERLFLRPVQLDDFQNHHAMRSDSTEFFTASTPDESWLRVLRHAGHWALLRYGVFTVIEKATERYLGEVGMADYRRGMAENPEGLDEAGWYFTKSAQAKGYAYESARAAHGWYLTRTDRHRTFCLIDEQNDPSIRLAGKLHYTPIQEAIYKGGKVIVFRREARTRDIDDREIAKLKPEQDG